MWQISWLRYRNYYVHWLDVSSRADQSHGGVLRSTGSRYETVCHMSCAITAASGWSASDHGWKLIFSDSDEQGTHWSLIVLDSIWIYMLQIQGLEILENEGGPWKSLKSHEICLVGFGLLGGGRGKVCVIMCTTYVCELFCDFISAYVYLNSSRVDLVGLKPNRWNISSFECFDTVGLVTWPVKPRRRYDL